MHNRFLSVAPVLASALLLSAGRAQAQSAFFAPGHMPNVMPGGHTYANSLSADGTTVVGYGWDAQNRERAWRWSAARGYEDLGDMGGGTASSYDVNADGSVVVGYSYLATNEHVGFRWTPATGMQALPMYEAIDVSGDGDFMVGLNVWRTVSGQTGNFDPGFNTFSAGVSTVGNVVVGYKYFGQYVHAFRWTAAGGLQDLGVLTGPESDARGVSGDGSVVVGEARDASIQQFWRAFRWTAASGMQDMGTLGGPMSNAFDASFDGSVIVGTSLISGSSASNRAFRWTAQTGMRDLKQELLAAGVTSVQNWILQTANGVSSDGRVIAGYGIPASLQPSQPFIAILPAPGGGSGNCYANCDASVASPVLNVADFTCFLQRYGAGDLYANCDSSTAAPVLNVADFTCFLQKFSSGCP